jgi:uncharacterized protein (DUF952 family)
MIYHITTKDIWANAQETKSIVADSLTTEGFIHMCYPEQLQGVLERHFSGKTNLMRLTINEHAISDVLKLEFSSGLNDTFPHCYAAIPLDAVTDAIEIRSSF